MHASTWQGEPPRNILFVCATQANNVMRTMLGPAAEGYLISPESHPFLDEATFVDLVLKALKGTVPYRAH